MSRVAASLSPLLAVFLFTAPALATPVAYGTGLLNPVTTIDFSGLADGTAVGASYAYEGVTFSGLTITSQYGSTLGATQAPAAANFATGQAVNPVFGITFSTVINDVAFFLATDGYLTTITSTLGGTAVETVQASQYANSGADYFGFIGSAFDGITISVGGSGTAIIDNVELGQSALPQGLLPQSLLPQAVPEPATPGIMVAGLVGLAVLSRRRQA